jgi:hypothetical protein
MGNFQMNNLGNSPLGRQTPLETEKNRKTVSDLNADTILGKELAHIQSRATSVNNLSSKYRSRSKISGKI